jgi:hypothetical protein
LALWLRLRLECHFSLRCLHLLYGEVLNLYQLVNLEFASRFNAGLTASQVQRGFEGRGANLYP